MTTVDVPAEVRQGIIERLVALHTEHGELSCELVENAAALLRRTPRQVRRLVAQALGHRTVGTRNGYRLTGRDKELYFAHRGIAAEVHKQLKEEGANPPGVRTLQRAFAAQTNPALRAFARDGVKGRQKYEVHLRHEPPHRNHTWEVDAWEFPLSVVVDERSTKWVRPWLVAFLDGRHRAVMGWVISLQHRKEEVLGTIRRAVEVVPLEGPFGGIPEVVRMDNGLEFLADDVTRTFQFLEAAAIPTAAFSPQHKGKIERFFWTIEREFVRPLPFYARGPKQKDNKTLYGPSAGPMLLSRLVAEFQAWLHHYNFERPHSALGGKTPLESWEDDPAPLRLVGADELRWIEMPSADRIVRNDGIHFARGTYVAPELNAKVGERVHLRYYPHDRATIEVFLDGGYLTTAERQEDLSVEGQHRITEQRKRDRAEGQMLMAKTSRKQRAWVAEQDRRPDHGGNGARAPHPTESPRSELADFDLLHLERSYDNDDGGETR